MNVLVLNQDYNPLMICTIQRAFLLVYLDKAEIIANVKNKYLRTIDKEFPCPSIIRISNYAQVPYKGVVLTRNNILKRDNNTCQYCGTYINLTLDHVIPKSKGGKSSWTNLVTACSPCNAKKSDFTLEEAGLQLKKKPVKPSYIMFLKNSAASINSDWLTYLEPKAYQ